MLPGINALAAPILDQDGKLCLVVGLVGHQETLDVGVNSKAAVQLCAFADRISAELGAMRDSDDDWVTARRMTIFSLAHRLGMKGHQVARRVVGTSEYERFKSWKKDDAFNPIDAYVPGSA